MANWLSNLIGTKLNAFWIQKAKFDAAALTVNRTLTLPDADVLIHGSHTGDVTSVGAVTTLTNAPVIAKVLTGYVSGAGTVAATDSILQAIQKLNGNDATNANLTGAVTSVGNATTVVTNANLTGDATSAGNATTVGKINGTSLAVLATGILKNTTTTGVPSIAVAADFPTLNQSTTGNAATVTTNANLTGGVTSAGNAATVITNANLTGPVTSVGNATTITANAVTTAMLAAATRADQASCYIQTPANGTFTLVAKATYAGTIDSLKGLKTSAGTATVTIKIGATNVTGLASLSVTSTAQDATATAANVFAIGDRITLTIASVASAADLEYTLGYTRT